MPNWNANCSAIDKNNNNTDRFRPDVGPGVTVLALSLPQHDPNKLVVAVQKHQVTLVIIQEIKAP
jgi:hypothetical protein